MDHAKKDPTSYSKIRYPRPLRTVIWDSYIKTALIPLVVIELGFLAVYWYGSGIIYRDTMADGRQVSAAYMSDIARREAANIDARLVSIANLAKFFAATANRALRDDHPLSPTLRARLAPFPQGGLYTRSDNGTTASYYSAINRIGPSQWAKVARLSALDGFMMDAHASDPLIASLYVNTSDSYNLIYPYIDVRKLIEPRTDVRTFNFYYEADASHNPERGIVWTDAYIDPAGHGWLVSALAPIWNDNTLEGVVGIDVKLDTIVERLLTMDLPWAGYAMLISKDGRILAMPPAGERDLGLRDPRDHDYRDAIVSNTFKPDTFNIAQRKDTAPLLDAIRRQDDGTVPLNLKGAKLASFAHIAGTGWTLAIIVPTERVYAHAESLNARLRMTGLLMIGALLAFYVAFFALLYKRARRMSRQVAEPLETIDQLLGRIRQGDHRQSFTGSKIAEIDALGRNLVTTGIQLGEANEKIIRQERIVSDALAQQKRINEEQLELVRHISHELRTPLAIIDSTAQIIERKAETLAPNDLRVRSNKLRSATKRMATALERLLTGTETGS